MEEAFRNAALLNSLRPVKGIRVKCLVCNDVVLQECLQILLPIATKQKCVDPGPKLQKGEI